MTNKPKVTYDVEPTGADSWLVETIEKFLESTHRTMYLEFEPSGSYDEADECTKNIRKYVKTRRGLPYTVTVYRKHNLVAATKCGVKDNHFSCDPTNLSEYPVR